MVAADLATLMLYRYLIAALLDARCLGSPEATLSDKSGADNGAEAIDAYALGFAAATNKGTCRAGA